MQEALDRLDDLRDRHLSDLLELLRIASVSADPDFKAEVSRAAEWVAAKFRGMGLTTTVVPTERHPLVFASSPPVPGKSTVLVYGHYDVQPPDPLDEWITPPFEPAIRDGDVVARGATDDKGQMLTHVLSAETWLNTVGQLPVQLKFVIEGEEEVGSESLYRALDSTERVVEGQTVAEWMKCDVAVISDSSQFAPGVPAVTYGLRGIAYYELRLTGPKQDLHSGVFGGAVTNPCLALAQMLAALKDERGRVQVPGFYDDVLPVSDAERKEFASLDFSEEKFRKQLDVQATTGEEGFTTLERRWARPSCDVHGLWGGYQKEGAKTVLPAKAGAKFSFRLVPNQDPQKISASLERFLRSILPPGIRMELIDMHGAPGCVVPIDSPYMSAARAAIETGFGKRAVFIREGGSIPIVGAFKQRLGMDTLLLGWGLDDDNTHSPNEKFHLADFYRGIRASAALWSELAKVTPVAR